MLKILRSSTNDYVILTLIGRLEGESLEEVKRVIDLEASSSKLVLDMKDVILLDQAAAQFLARCEADQVTLEHCPAYIRNWITAEKRRDRSQASRDKTSTVRWNGDGD
jgi:hypothetical protein